MAPDVRMRRVRAAREVIELAEPHEPRATVLLDSVIDRGLGRGVRAWIAELPDGRPGALLVTFRLCRDRWFAAPLLFDETAAVAVGRRINRTPAYQLVGTADNVAPVLGHVRRAGTVLEMPYSAFRGDKETMEKLTLVPDDNTRLASPADLDELVDVYRGYELDFFTTEPRLRYHLRAALRGRRVAVVERDGRIVGAFRAEWVSRHYIHWGSLTVLPEYRGQGLAWPVQWRAILFTAFGGQGVSWTQHPSNPMAPPVQPVDTTVSPEVQPVSDTWLQVRLRPRVRGVGRLHRALERIEGRLRPRNPPASDRSRWEAARARGEKLQSEIGVDRLEPPR